jgi:hypothetical protein
MLLTILFQSNDKNAVGPGRWQVRTTGQTIKLGDRTVLEVQGTNENAALGLIFEDQVNINPLIIVEEA